MTADLHKGTAPGFAGLLVQSLHHNYFRVLHRSGEARKSAVFAAPDGLHHNYLADHYGEAGKPGFTTAPLRVASLLEKVATEGMADLLSEDA